jgi:hypothetical protein
MGGNGASKRCDFSASVDQNTMSWTLQPRLPGMPRALSCVREWSRIRSSNVLSYSRLVLSYSQIEFYLFVPCYARNKLIISRL